MTKKAKTALARRGATVSKAKFEQVKLATRARAQRAAHQARQRSGAIVAALGAAALGYAESHQKIAPKYTSPAVLGALGAVPILFPMKGKVGEFANELGAGLLSVAAYKLGQGQAIVGADDGDGDDEVSGEWGESG